MRESPGVRVATVTTRTLLLLRAPYQWARFSSRLRLEHFKFFARNFADFALLRLCSSSVLRLPPILGRPQQLLQPLQLCDRFVFCSVLVSSSALHSPLLLLCLSFWHRLVCIRLCFDIRLSSAFASRSRLQQNYILTTGRKRRLPLHMVSFNTK